MLGDIGLQRHFEAASGPSVGNKAMEKGEYRVADGLDPGGGGGRQGLHTKQTSPGDSFPTACGSGRWPSQRLWTTGPVVRNGE